MANEGFSPEIQKHIDATPAAARAFISSGEMGKAVHAIGSKHQLHIDQIGALEAEIMAAMIGITDPNDLVENIAAVLNIDEQKSTLIANDANSEIFSKVRESMKGSPQEPKKEPLASQIPITTGNTPIVPTPSVAEKPAAMPAPVPTPAPIAPAVPDHMAAADTMLSEKKVTPPPTPAPAAPAQPAAAPGPAASVPPASPTTPANSPVLKVDPSQPQNYKADPYREPVE